jgi:putative membrane protein
MSTKATIRNCALTLGMAGFCCLGATAQNTVSGAQRHENGNNTPISTGSSTGATSSTSHTASSDRLFVRKAAQGGLAEVQLGQLATEKAASPEVKQFGQRMVDDHTKANDQLKQIAQQQGIQVPDQLDAKDAATKARLEKLSGKEFDRAYMHDMVMDHTKDVTEFKHEANSGKDSAVKSFAQQTVPTLEDHLKEAKNIAPKVGAKSAHASGAAATSHSGSEQ